MSYDDNFRYVYVDYREDDGTPFYVGIGSLKRTKNQERNIVHKRIANKHGMKRNVVKCFPITAGEDGKISAEDVVQLALTERYLIRGLKTHISQGGANLTDGGEMISGGKHCNATKSKIATAHRGNRKSLEHRQKLSAARRGKGLSLDHRAKISEAGRGKKKSAEHRAKISEAASNRPSRSAEHRAKIAAANRIRRTAERLQKERPELSYVEAKAIVLADAYIDKTNDKSECAIS